jgi:hypothetical protein
MTGSAMETAMVELRLVQKDGRPPPMEPYRFTYQQGVSEMQHPNGSWIAVRQDAPLELLLSMTIAWNEERRKAS